MSNLTVERLTRDMFAEFMSNFYFEGKHDPNFGEVYFAPRSFSYAVRDEGRIIGAFGLCSPWRGLGEVWLMSTEYLNEYPVWMVRQFRALTDLALRNGCHRVQMFVNAHDVKLNRWAKILGFRKEGVLKKHSANKEDHAVYAKTA